MHMHTIAGGKKVLDGVGSELKLQERHLEPSASTLRYYGNVSSASTWYALGWLENCKGIQKGEKILQVRTLCRAAQRLQPLLRRGPC